MDHVLTVGDLRRLLEGVSDDTPLEIAATPDVNGWTQHVLACMCLQGHKVVLALAEETVTPDEQRLSFYDGQGNVVRPC